jgi:ParB-like chromosome segregation protein Spo0J
MNVIAQFNQLSGKTVSRKSLIELKNSATLQEIDEVAFRIDTILNQYPEALEFYLVVDNPIIEIGLGAAQTQRVGLNDCGRLMKGYRFFDGKVVKAKGRKRRRKVIKRVAVKKEAETPENKTKKIDLKKDFKKAAQKRVDDKKGSDFIYEATGSGYYVKTFIELPTSRSIKLHKTTSNIKGLLHYNVTDKGLQELKANLKGLYGDKNTYNSKDLFNPNEKNDPEPKTSIITDKSEVQKYKNSIAEGEEILRSGKFNGRKKTYEDLLSVLRSVNNSRKKIGLPPTEIEVKEKNSPSKKPASNLKTLELSKITLDPKRFQNRSKLNEDIVNNIVNNFNETELDPLIIWNNKGKNYLLAGHHRFEGLSQLKKKTAPVKFFTGTEAEAVEFAKVKSNSNRSLETPIERAKIYREMKGTKKAIEDKAREIEGKNASYILNLAALNPKGILIETLEKLAVGDKQNASLVEKIADWIGDAKRTYSNLTNTHEKEMFDFLMNKDDSKRITNKADFKQKIYAIAGAFDFEPTKALNLKRFKHQTEGEKVYENEFNELKTKVSDKVQAKADLIDRLSNVKRQDFIPADDDKDKITAKLLADMNAEIKQLQAKLIELSQNKGTYTSGGQNQASLFGGFSEPEIHTPELIKAEQTKPQVKNALMDMEFDSLQMDEGWENLMQDPARNMKIAIWGKPKNGKTSAALQKANYLTKFGNVLYVFVDQGFNKNTQDLWRDSGLATKPNATPSNITSSKDLEKELKTGKYTFCFIDMISDWIRTEKMKPEEFKERFMRQFPEVSFILIFEVTKGGDFKGDQGWTHLVDAIMTVEDFIIENRGRYGMGEKIVWEEGAAKFNPKRFAELQSNLVPKHFENEENIFNTEVEVL